MPSSNHPGGSTTIPNPYGATPATISAVASISPAQINLIKAVAAANPHTIVVLNTTNPVLLPFISSVKSVLETVPLWTGGRHVDRAAAPGARKPEAGHTAMTWPKNATDTLWAYTQRRPLYPGDHTGPHLERLNHDFGSTGPYPACVNPAAPSSTSCTDENEGIFTGYRFYDKLGIPTLFPFGRGLSYTTFRFSHLKIARRGHEADVRFDVINTGSRAGGEVAQVYVGAGSEATVQQAIRSLRGFARVDLAAGEREACDDPPR